MINIVPLGDRVLLTRIDEDTEKQGSFYVPDIAQVKSSRGKVVAIGEGRIVGDKLFPLPLEVGDEVLFSKYGAVEVTIEGQDLLVLRYDEIYFKVPLVVVPSYVRGSDYAAFKGQP
ncbi:MAG: co-chaperone GroES [Acidobacteria bacterium Pan2503]|uniref:Co-chaperonin GroES n=1 Tax=Candidatus Acidiferrum panamense TaxID=2741543 RepID=A0A7V8NTL1_9BACT|nr:co-chaperone GroES [Candidatus Acidoferrum panamensis]